MSPAASQTLPANRLGRDFLVGDLHGAYSSLMRSLDAVEFDESRDRVICTGDLVDRGPESFDCLGLLLKGWFKSVPGNHEVMMWHWSHSTSLTGEPPPAALRAGAQWLYQLNPAQRAKLYDELLPRVEALPLVLSVAHDRFEFRVLHAQATFAGHLLTDELLQEKAVQEGSDILWARSLIEQLPFERLQYHQLGRIRATSTPWSQGLGLTYVGHNIVDCPLLHRSHLFIDCAAHLTAHDPEGTLQLFSHDKVIEELQDARLVASE